MSILTQSRPYRARDDQIKCPYCGTWYYPDHIDGHKNRCGCNPALTNTMELSKGRMFFKYHPRTGSTDYFFVIDVGCRAAPFSGIEFHIPPKDREYSVRIKPLNEYAGENLEPKGWKKCTDKHARKAIEELLQYMNRIGSIALQYIIGREGGDDSDRVVPMTEDGDD